MVWFGLFKFLTFKVFVFPDQILLCGQRYNLKKPKIKKYMVLPGSCGHYKNRSLCTLVLPDWSTGLSQQTGVWYDLSMGKTAECLLTL